MTVSGPQDTGDPRVDEQARERSAEQRNITAPTPADVRAKDENDDAEDAKDGKSGKDGAEPSAPGTDT
ncbi:hypothetical protein XF35_40805 [Streptomyces platensis subsp. clarensis]|uniref:Uncharacterized protein n=1 Tax=Streptomyces showdoensis TaxID=68268 RepID=A0A2P2GHB2_STREW|nr:hypothetical protein VO63_26360 [Streptomyces showdoensis]MCW7991372.1 hypothetical protein [Streptomyces platensis subsp. clarensis]